ncbi:hypothetical protein V1478_010906 [Vespula squamosa]|uniref:Uncharacterized protein n=1 Tax=Vespula squamosa TaxID=30214 RepID=A0ABD2AFT2_VESSQ
MVCRDSETVPKHSIAFSFLKAFAISIAHFLISSPSQKLFLARAISRATAYEAAMLCCLSRSLTSAPCVSFSILYSCFKFRRSPPFIQSLPVQSEFPISGTLFHRWRFRTFEHSDWSKPFKANQSDSTSVNRTISCLDNVFEILSKIQACLTEKRETKVKRGEEAKKRVVEGEGTWKPVRTIDRERQDRVNRSTSSRRAAYFERAKLPSNFLSKFRWFLTNCSQFVSLTGRIYYKLPYYQSVISRFTRVQRSTDHFHNSKI